MKSSTVNPYDLVIKDYDGIADWYSQTYNGANDFETQLDLFTKKLPKKSKVLDVGCGPGRESNYLSNHGFQAVGVDVSEKMLTIYRQVNPDFKSYLASMLNLPFNNDIFDAIWTARAIIHIKKEDLATVFHEFYRVLKPKGIIGLITMITKSNNLEHEEKFIDEPGDKNLVYWINYYSEKILEIKLKEAKFRVIHKSTFEDADKDKLIFLVVQK